MARHDLHEAAAGGMGRPRGILLDMYGTLVPEDYPIVRRIVAALAASVPGSDADEIGRRWSRAYRAWSNRAHGAAFRSQRAVARGSLAEVAAAVGATVDLDALLATQFAHWTAPPLFPESRAFLAGLAERGLPVCLVSNIDRADLRAALAAHALTLPYIVTSEEVRAYKPRPEPFRAALARLGLTAGEVVHIGDSRTSDVAGAQALGIPVIWVNRLGTPPPDPPPTAMVPDLTAIMGWLDAG